VARLAGLLLCAAASAARAQGAPAAPRPVTVTITATPGRLAVSADSVAAGPVTLTLQNRAGTIVSAQLLAVRNDHTPADAARLIAAGQPLPEWIGPAGGVGNVAPGASAGVTFAMPPGGYVIASTVTDSTGMPQYRRGYTVTLQATGRRQDASVPGVSLAIVAGNAGFRISRVEERNGERFELLGRARGRALSHGDQILEIETQGSVAHEVEIVRMDSTAMLRQYVNWMARGQRGRAPGRPAGGVGVLPPGRKVWMRVRLEPGSYWIYCNAVHRAGMRGYETGEYTQIAVR